MLSLAGQETWTGDGIRGDQQHFVRRDELKVISLHA